MYYVKAIYDPAAAYAVSAKDTVVDVGGKWGKNAFTHLKTACNTVCQTAYKVDEACSKIVCDIYALQNTARVAVYFNMGLRFIRDTLGVDKLGESLMRFSNFVDATRGPVHGYYFISGDYKAALKDGRIDCIAGRAFLLLSGIAGGMAWLAEAGALNLAKIGATVGRIPLFRFVGSLSQLKTFGLFSAGMGLAMLALDNIGLIGRGHHSVQAWYDLVNCAAETAFIAFLYVGGASVGAHVVLGLLAAGSGVAAFLHSQYQTAKV